MAFTKTSIVKDVVDDAQACTILEKYFPGITTHDLLDEAFYFTLEEVSSIPETGVSRETLDAIFDELAALP